MIPGIGIVKWWTAQITERDSRMVRKGSDSTSDSHPSPPIASLGHRLAARRRIVDCASDHRLSRGPEGSGRGLLPLAERACSSSAPQTAVLAMASFERTSTSGALGSCGWGIAAKANSAIAPGQKTRQ